jgi:putative SOS response-associated peptidase YedK
LWETWRSPADERVRSFAVITTEPNELCARLHNRMPVVLQPEAWPVWLGEKPTDLTQLKALLAPYPSDQMTAWPVSARRQRQEQRFEPHRTGRRGVNARSAAENLSTWTIIEKCC